MEFYHSNRKLILQILKLLGEYDDKFFPNSNIWDLRTQAQTKGTDSERNGPRSWLNIQEHPPRLLNPP